MAVIELSCTESLKTTLPLLYILLHCVLNIIPNVSMFKPRENHKFAHGNVVCHAVASWRFLDGKIGKLLPRGCSVETKDIC